MTGTGIISIAGMVLYGLAIIVAWLAALDEALKNLLVGAGVNATMIVSYWVGSSAGSRAKDEIIARNGS